MREFKNKKARELFLESIRLDKAANEKEKEEIKECGHAIGENGHAGSIVMHVEAAGLRALADDIEDGYISEDELEIE